ncbi:hypothetical protein Acsp03_59670 [Actinomadura sp. NBRC 104412]|uniref:AI-2E family transporter n=1 Tax=Actinomadura sp. NBRC 104412 TaxID=3032203 RepID=UPI0024A4808F|nr:AI-2E family transporter [Actinomadura sp. NBRC 104412]GLZ08501.1 hypothetical protein Acsp03_59670 [Actinomadura sp. NBRC 104412]
MTAADRRDPRGWDAVPAPLRTAALASACVLIVAGTVYLLVQLLVQLAPLTLAIVVALLLAALVHPLSDRLRRARVPPWIAALTGVLALLVVVTGSLVLIGERVVDQVPNLQRSLNAGLGRLRDFALNGPFPISQAQVDSVVNGVMRAARGAAPDPVGGATVAAQAVGSILLAIVLLFFMLKDGRTMWQWTLRAFPARFRSSLDAAAEAGWVTLVSYVRGIVLIALVDAVGIGVALVLIGVPLALPLALLTFIAAFVPIIGATVAGAAAVLVAFVTNGPGDALLVLAAVIVVQQAEGNLLQPLIQGRALSLHPAVVLVAVTAGTLLGGIAGAAVAVPLVAVANRVTTVLRTTPPADDPT